MSVGLGIFLGSVFIGTVLLYLKTEGRWNWKKIGKRTLIALSVFFAVCGMLVLGAIGYEKWEQQPQVVTSLKGIAIGDKFSDVVFKHGVFEKKNRNPDAVQKYQDAEDYVQNEISIAVLNSRILSIDYNCKKESDYTSLNRIFCYDSGDEVKERFGSEVKVLCSKKNDENSQFLRVYDVAKYGTRYWIWRNKVWAFLVLDKTELDSLVGLNWDVCN